MWPLTIACGYCPAWVWPWRTGVPGLPPPESGAGCRAALLRTRQNFGVSNQVRGGPGPLKRALCEATTQEA